MLRFIPILLILLLFVSISVAGAAQARFFTELNDIPLMPGLYELAEETVVFDKAEGRIVETAAVSETVKSNEIKAFYSATLPQLGWVRVGPDIFQRQGEKLTLRLETRGNIEVLKLSLTP